MKKHSTETWDNRLEGLKSRLMITVGSRVTAQNLYLGKSTEHKRHERMSPLQGTCAVSAYPAFTARNLMIGTP